MKNALSTVPFFLIFLAGNTGLTQEKCFTGSPEKTHLIDQLKKAKSDSPVTKIISDKYKLSQSTEADANCKECTEQKNIYPDFKKIAEEKTHFNTECIEAAASIDTDSNEISCPDAKTGKHNFCFSKPLVEYQNAVVSEFYKCVKHTNPMPITPQGLFEMYTLESGFKPAYTNAGGTGLGQLTGIFIKDLHQKHRGRPILESIVQSTESTCDAAKIIIKKDLNHEPSLKNKCEFTQYGEGLERNILYTLTGLANTWNKDISPKMKDYSKKYMNDPYLAKAQEKALFNAYGPGGRAAGRAAARRLSILSPEKFVAAIQKPLITKKNRNLTAYTTHMLAKQKNISKKLSGDLKQQFINDGAAACID